MKSLIATMFLFLFSSLLISESIKYNISNLRLKKYFSLSIPNNVSPSLRKNGNILKNNAIVGKYKLYKTIGPDHIFIVSQSTFNINKDCYISIHLPEKKIIHQQAKKNTANSSIATSKDANQDTNIKVIAPPKTNVTNSFIVIENVKYKFFSDIYISASPMSLSSIGGVDNIVGYLLELERKHKVTANLVKTSDISMHPKHFVSIGDKFLLCLSHDNQYRYGILKEGKFSFSPILKSTIKQYSKYFCFFVKINKL